MTNVEGVQVRISPRYSVLLAAKRDDVHAELTMVKPILYFALLVAATRGGDHQKLEVASMG